MSDTTENTAPKSAGLTAKVSSHVAQIVAAVWIAAWSAFKFFSAPAAIGIDDVILSGVGIAACFLPVYFSIIMDKIRDISIGGDK